MNIRKAIISDIQKIEEIVKINSFETGRDYFEIINSTHKGIFVVEKESRITGFFSYEFKDWNNTVQIINIFILPEFRRNGFGSKLIQHLIEFVKDKNSRTILAEAPSNSNAPGLYKKNGFRKCGYNDRYYDNTGQEIAEFYSYDLN